LSGQVINLLSEVKTFIPWVSFIAGLGGSLHCVGMCGGLVTATCEKSHDVIRYQLGRLIGYLCLGLFAGMLGSFFNIKSLPAYFSLIPALMIGVLFIFWGMQNYSGKKAEIPAPKILRNLYTNLWARLIRGNKNFTKAFLIGLLSILLPCGLLYGVVIGTVALEHTTSALISMLFFWVGTLPSMVVAPGIIQRFLKPLRLKLPKTYALSLVAIGIMTITFRMIKLYGQQNELRSPEMTKENVHSCH
jgi:sulfite exporter TauE/SafE